MKWDNKGNNFLKGIKKTGIFQIGLVFLIWWGVEKALHLGSFCFFKGIFGIPCPGCGMTRAYFCVLSGNIESAFYWHPLWALVPLVVFIGYLNRHKTEKVQALWLMPILVMLIGVYIFRMLKGFPNVAPMDFNQNALLIQILHYFKMWFL